MSNIKQRIRFLEADAKHHHVKSSSIMMVSTITVLSIIEEFRELEQRAEAAWAEAKHQLGVNVVLCRHNQAIVEQRDKALTQLSELAKQESVGWLVGLPGLYPTFTKDYRNVEQAEKAGGYEITPIFTRAAPASVPADLVPDENTQDIVDENIFAGMYGYKRGWNACRAEMLRRIEG